MMGLGYPCIVGAGGADDVEAAAVDDAAADSDAVDGVQNFL